MEHLHVREVQTRKELERFIAFNTELYKGNSCHVPGLVSEELMTLDKVKNPAFEVCDAIYYLAWRGEKIVGRIAGIINRKSNEVWKQKYARFGFVDFVDDEEVSAVLFDTVEQWAKEQGMQAIVGPMGFTDLDHEGMLVEGFDQLGTMATIYNYPYYPVHLEQMGYGKEQDWHEFKIYIPEAIPEKHLRIGEIVKQKYGLEVMKFKSAKALMPYAQQVFQVLNASYAPLFGFAPLSQKQIDYYLSIYVPMLRLDMVTVIVRKEDDRVIGFGISLPSLSRALQKAKGSLLPFGWFHLLKALKTKPRIIDLYLMGVLPEYQNKGVNALLFNDLIPIYRKLGVEYAESNPELESNTSVQAQWEYFRREHHKTRRVYLKPLC